MDVFTEVSQPSLKRARIDESPNVAHWQRSDEFWYPDGSVILIADATAFRVYQGILAEQSTVFRDMFTLPQPEVMESMDGCPVVRLSDHVSDLTHLLREVFGKSGYFDRDCKDKIPIECVGALTRLSHKYQFEVIREKALGLLRDVFPTSLPKGYIDFATYLSKSMIAMSAEDCITVVNLGRLTETLSILPFAFYGCYQVANTNVILRGITRGDRTERLSQEDIEAYVKGLRLLLESRPDGFSNVFISGGQCECDTPQDCKSWFLRLMHSIWFKSDPWGPDTLGPWTSYLDHFPAIDRPCSECCGDINAMAVYICQEEWDCLPDKFQLMVPKWSVSASN
ncbi:hypothetical protein CERSUDRAFT_55122 [Gelatoporia subvermispora B]|uniref:BTB domain-containing protein n=1 Tax=Ceriporiopsis subvermispora (strain B) TaxID=914234 RepID=M2PEC5_CERS8|nr:hypothetical protein CERSUDRAFT_55122 [Gelatoporia subvermispora B]